MFAQQPYRPEIARVAEETVLNLKQLESRIEVLKNDLAALCTVLGHPEAARIAVTPASWLGVTAPHLAQDYRSLSGVGTLGMNPLIQSQVPFQGQAPFQGQGFGISPFGQVPGASPFAQGLGPGISPFGQGISPYGASFGTPFGSTLTPFR